MIKEVRFEIGCNNLSEQVDFYKNILGAEEVSNDNGFVVLELAGVKFSLWDANEQKEAQKVGISMVTDNPEGLQFKLQENRCIVTKWENCPMFLTVDADGHGVSILTE